MSSNKKFVIFWEKYPYLTLVFLGVVIFLIVFWGGQREAPTDKVEFGKMNKKEVVLVLDFNNYSQTRRFRTIVEDGETIKAWSLLQQASAHGAIDLQISDGFVPVSINGVSAAVSGPEQKSWHLYVNNKEKALEPFNVLVKAGDEVIFKFE